MKRQIQERPGTLRFLIGSVIILCALTGSAGADELSAFSFLSIPGYEGSGGGKQGELLVRFVETDKQIPSGLGIVGPRSTRAIRETISGRAVKGASVGKEYDRVVPGLTLIKLPKGQGVVDAMMRFNQTTGVIYAEPNYKYKFLRIPNDPNFPKQWGLHNTGQTGGRADADIDAPEAWDITTGSKNVVVAILDSGIDMMHPDLVVNLWMNSKEMAGKPNVDDDGNGYIDDYYGYDFLNNDADPSDDFYHGTHVAGVIGAFGNNMIGVAGVCWNVSLMPLKVGDANGVNVDSAISAIDYAVVSGAKIINASWGGYDYSEGLKDAIEAAGKKGVLVVAAAGNEQNDNDRKPVYPAGYDASNIVSVMATNSRDQMSWFSNYGATSVDIGEPGEDIWSTLPSQETPAMASKKLPKSYGQISGTSQAAAYVSGASAMVLSRYSTLSAPVIKHILLQTADPVLPGLCISNGRVNLYKALTVMPKGRAGKVLNTRDNPLDPRAPYSSIQAAIDKAIDGDTLVAEGVSDANIIFTEHIDFHGKKITIRSGSISNPSNQTIYPEKTLILGYMSSGSVVTFANGEGSDSVLKGFTIAWGNADYGGGIRCDGTSPTISYCIINNNVAKYYGGGIDSYNGSPKITNCVVANNRTYGNSAIGAGINCEGGSTIIADCIIRNNTSNNVGGGIGCYSTSTTIFNCVITNNAAVYGSGQIDLDDASPSITNCTIVVDKGNPSQDGGISAYNDSYPTIKNCIIWGNGDDLFGCSATYSCIEDDDTGVGNIHEDPIFVRGPLGVYYLSQVKAGQLANSPCIDAGSPNTHVALLAQLRLYTTRTDGVTDANLPDLGAHYGTAPAKMYTMTVTEVGADSKPVDPSKSGGRVDPNSGTYREFEVVQLKAYPKSGYRIKAWKGTDSDSTIDPNKVVTILGNTQVTIQFEEIPLRKLVTSVVGGHGIISPSHRRGEYYLDGTIVELSATPDAGWIVDQWTGTDNNKSRSTLNLVTMNGDKEVTVKFREPKSLHVPGQYRSISQAIVATYTHGDKVIVAAGTYYENSLDFGGKAITLASEHPDDPCCVASTIIDCANRGRAFIFQSGEGTDSIVDGFTIRNGSAVYDPNAAPNSGGRGTDGEAAFGGAIACFKGSSPTLSNLVISNCRAQGRNGENSSFVFATYPAPPAQPDPPDAPDQLPDPNDAVYDPNDPNAPADPNGPITGTKGQDGQIGQDGANGADGLDGQNGYPGGDGGNGYGGAMYFDANSTPTILHCTIINCRAIGGNGGFGGAGQSGQDGQNGQNGQDGQQGQNGGAGANDGPDGAGGNGGNGGNGGSGGKAGAGGAGGVGGAGGEALGGAIYFGPNCQPTIRYCTVTNSFTREGLGNAGGNAGAGGASGSGGTGGQPGDSGDGEPAGTPGTAGTDGAGANGGAGGKGGNMGRNGGRSWGGAIYFGTKCEIEITDTVVSYNTAYIRVATTAYQGGQGGAGGNGGSAGGAGGAGGDGRPLGAGGSGGAAGQDGSPGQNGTPGDLVSSVTTSYGGGNVYEGESKATLINCRINNNTAEDGDGGGEHYMGQCTAVLTRCYFTGNSAGVDGGGESFDKTCSVKAETCSYISNRAGHDGGGLYCWGDCVTDVNGSTFNSNVALGTYGSGGGLYGGGAWDNALSDWYNGGKINIRKTGFASNKAAFGGGLYWYGDGAEVAINDCVISNNTAEHGGGAYWSRGAPTIVNCSVKGNNATGSTYTVPAPIPPDPNDPNSVGDPNAVRVVSSGAGSGGGLLCWSSSATIENCFISLNTVTGSGGGVYLGGDTSTPKLKNCLVKENTSTIDGGGVVSAWYVTPAISNCTIVENKTSDPNVSDRGYGGGLSCTHESKTILVDSILWGNSGTQGGQIAIGNKSDPIYIQRPATLTVSYCDIQGGQSATAIHVEPGRILNWLGGNINAYPLFVASYYLSQIAAGQGSNSPCVDAGSNTATNLGLNGMSTRLDGVFDTGVGDIGFHYTPVGRYSLTIKIVGSHGTVEPGSGTYHEYTVVTLHAKPDLGYRVKSWTGTDHDPSWNRNTNTVTLASGSKTVTVEFELAVTRNMYVPSEYQTIEQAVAAASPGDTNIIISEGVHYITDPNGIDFHSKNITLMSSDPNNPSVVADTIIDCQGTRYRPKRAFHFHSGEDPNCTLLGLTIKNGYINGAIAAGGRMGMLQPVPYEIINPDDPTRSPPRAERGQNITGYGYGGGILCENGSSPTIKNCVIMNCVVTGGQGGDGASGMIGAYSYLPLDPTADVQTTNDGQWGGHAGTGSGTGYGGAIACRSGGSPIIINCTIKDNFARGGCGGTGGPGGMAYTEDGTTFQGLESYGGNGGNAIGDGVGGAIYCENSSNPTIIDCKFVNNNAVTGLYGTGGAVGRGNARSPARAAAGSPGSVTSLGGIAGGAIYSDASDVNMVGCEFVGNAAKEIQPISVAFGLYNIRAVVQNLDIYSVGGAVYSGPGGKALISGCKFEGNFGGAVYIDSRCVVDINDSLFTDNEAKDQNDIQFYTAALTLFLPNTGQTAREHSGGALYVGPNCSSVSVRNSGFYTNYALNDGGAVRTRSSTNFTNCMFGGNKAGGNGGGVDAYRESSDPNQKIIINLNVGSCVFGGNQATDGIAGWGGGGHFHNVNAKVTDCYFISNRAKSGGGLFCAGGTLSLSGGGIRGNKAKGGSGIDTSNRLGNTQLYLVYPIYDSYIDYYFSDPSVLGKIDLMAGECMGGGIVCANTEATIEHTTMSDNIAEAGDGAGGAISFFGGHLNHVVRNCLLTGNYAKADGGAIWANLYAKPDVRNCTLSGNSAGRFGGAIFCKWDADVTATDSIFQKCDTFAIVEEDFGNSVVKSSLFDKNTGGDYGIYDTATGSMYKLSGRDLDITNKVADPLFVNGPFGGYYLSQTESGQTTNSPAVDAGSGFAVPAGLSMYTTRTDGNKDAGIVDIGFHYIDHTGVPQYALTTSVKSGHGVISPSGGTYYAGTAVTLTAVPESGWRVARWSGTIDDLSTTANNFVIMGPDRHVTVEFKQPRTIVVGSDPNSTSIQEAIDAAADGDVVILKSGQYRPAANHTERPWGFEMIEVRDKAITLTSVNPDDPAVVASTILDGYWFRLMNVGSDTIIDGITIRNSNRDGLETVNTTTAADDGGNGDALYGGAMQVINASPTIRNCIIRDCSVTGGDGAPGDNGNQQHPVGYDGGWAGKAFGGAVYCGYNANPTFENCSFMNCFARGGNGGDGGNGYQNAKGGRGGSWEWGPSLEEQFASTWWDGWEWGDKQSLLVVAPGQTGYDPYDAYIDPYWKYSGYGGGVYCEYYSAPKFVDCTFTNNRSYGGVCGIGGTAWRSPDRNLKIEMAGGAVYACKSSSPEFVNCVFANNIADPTMNYIATGGALSTVTNNDDPYFSYGGTIGCEEDAAIKLLKCTIRNSQAHIGGAVYWSNSNVVIEDCNISDGIAYHGAGLYSVDSTGMISGSTVARNRAYLAFLEPNDVNNPNPVANMFSWGGGYCCLSSIVEVNDSVFTDNGAASSGGGIYFGGSDQQVAFTPVLRNCLIKSNTAGRDGGGVSTNWPCEPIISNCTIADNLVSGAFGTAFGGGLYCSYGSNTVVTDSIIWGNVSNDKGSQISVGGGGKYGPRTSTLTVSYSDIQPDPDPNELAGRGLDIVFCIDSTSSMADDINAVKVAATQIVDLIAKKVPDYRIAVVEYRDFNDPNGGYGDATDFPYRVVTPFTSDSGEVIGGINAIVAAGGADFPESVYSALMNTIRGVSLGSWRGGKVNRVILLMGDAPPHDPEPFTGYTLNGVVTAALQLPDKKILPVLVGQDVVTTAYFRNLAAGTGAPMLEAADANAVVGMILSGIDWITRVAPSIYAEPECKITWWNPATGLWDADSHNIGVDPLFIAGYYLSQTASGQLVQSPCVNVGSADANAPTIKLETLTTRTDGVGDANIVDMGYHYSAGLLQYRLTVTVLADANGVFHGRVDPNVSLVYEGFGSNVVTLKAYPDVGYKVKKWTGTDNDASVNRTNTVTVKNDKNVTVEFEPAPLFSFIAYVIDRGDGPHGYIDPNSGQFYDGVTIPLRAIADPNYEVKVWTGTDNNASREPNNTATVNGADVVVSIEFGLIGRNIINLYDATGRLDRRSPFRTIQDAVNAAASNYEVVLSDGVYSGTGNYNINISAGLGPNDVRPMTVRSENGPAECIIDCEGLGRAFIFDTNEDPNYVIRGLTLRNGLADNGGAILCDMASPGIEDCKIINNTATGNGGAIYCTASSPQIVNTEISMNSAGGFGGGIYAQASDGTQSVPAIINCLITFNMSADIGGSIFLQDSPAIINMCTVAYNYGLAYNQTNDMYPKGGICARDSDPVITNCIIGRNGYYYYSVEPDVIDGRWGDTLYVGDDLYGCDATYSCIENGDDGQNNIATDPLWVNGPLGKFYLSQGIGGQMQMSPCIDAGEQFVMQTLQDTYNLGNVTTSIINSRDAGYADMGYHHQFFTGPPIQWKLEISIVGNGRVEYLDPNGMPVVVEPNKPGEVYYYSPGMMVLLTAVPDTGNRLFKWTGTDADASTARTNYVTMGSDKKVIVEFEKKVARTINVPNKYTTIQEAVYAAREGDTVVVDPGRYFGGYEGLSLIVDKSIVITSRNPNDPCTVESTIIDGYRGTNPFHNIGVIFMANADSNTVFNGFTIQNCGGSTGDSDDGDRNENHPNGYDGTPNEGAAMYIMAGANPVIKNCVLRNNLVIGGNAGNGVNADENNNAGRGGWGGWARGGAVYCFPDSGATFVNCRIENNLVRGGNGGNGGDYDSNGGYANYGGNWSSSQAYDFAPTGLTLELVTGNLWEVWEWDYGSIYWYYLDPNYLLTKTSYIGDYRWYSGYGGGVYCDVRSQVNFISCKIRGNQAQGGMSGQGGVNSAAGRNEEPLVAYELPSYGGGVYCAADTTIMFKDCTFENNITSPTIAGTDPNHRLDPYRGYGGGVAAESSAVIVFADCNFVGNEADTGGGLYVDDANAIVVDCNVTSNRALRGAGIASFGGLFDVISSDIANNEATTDPNDATDNYVFSAGAGLYLLSTDGTVRDCNISGNVADSSGGGIYLRGGNSQSIINCLVRNNGAGRDGGGVSVNWYATPLIGNCTFVGNAAAGIVGEPNDRGYGGALFAGYESNCMVTDSIFWQNYGLRGTEIAVGTGFELDQRCATLSVIYSDVMSGPNDIWVDKNCKFNLGSSNIRVNPLFVTGPLGDFYLNNTSPCVDAGSNLAGKLGMSRYTTRTDALPDTGRVDIGYHYPFLEPCKFCDLVRDGVIRFDDFAVLASKWLNEGCSWANDWCNGADLTFDSGVELQDLAIFAECWLVEDTNPPLPDPSEWATAPRMLSTTIVEMIAKQSFDGWGWDVEYYFDCVYGNCHDSGWQKKNNLYRDVVASGGEYGYRVKARDTLGNETEWSEVRFAGTVDTRPPAPAPHIQSINAVSSRSITMTASTSYDENSVEYFFDANTTGAHDSSWQTSPVYTDPNLNPNTTYCYRVKARDLSTNKNETAWSAFVCATTQLPADNTPPTPNPMQWDATVDANGFDGLPREIYGGAGTFDYYAVMTAAVATDPSGGIQYYFECVDNLNLSSGWQTANTFRVQVGRRSQGLRFRVMSQDALGNKTGWSTVEAAILRTAQ